MTCREASLVLFMPVCPGCAPPARVDGKGQIADWEQTWRQLIHKAAASEKACLDNSNISQLDEFKDKSDEDPPIWEWMDKCLWDGVSKLRSEVRALRATKAVPETHQPQPVLKNRLAEFRAQQERLAESLDVTEKELWNFLNHFGEKCERWAFEPSALPLEPSALPGWTPDIEDGPYLPVKSSPPWRGVCGGDGGLYVTGRLGNASPLLASPSKSKTERKYDVENDTVIQDIREALAALEEEVRQAGGITGGWGEVNHEMFMRTFRLFRRQSSEVLSDRLAERLRGVTQDAIDAHVTWYLEFEQRQSEKRKLLTNRRYRLKELEQRSAEVARVTAFKENQRKEGLNRCRSKELRRQIDKWRIEQAESQKSADAIAAQQREKEIQSEKDRIKKEKEQQKELKKAATAFRKKREAVEEALREKQKAAQTPPRLSPEVKLRIRNRRVSDLRQHVEKQRELREAEKQQRYLAQQTNYKNPAYQHIQSNVYASTAAFRCRVKARMKEQMGLSDSEPEPEEPRATAQGEKPVPDIHKDETNETAMSSQRTDQASFTEPSEDPYQSSAGFGLSSPTSFEVVSQPMIN